MRLFCLRTRGSVGPLVDANIINLQYLRKSGRCKRIGTLRGVLEESAVDCDVDDQVKWLIEIPFSSTSEDVQEYRLNAESGEMVLQLAPD